ncbi:hypothetical protein EV121DRAFT_293024 [Schizophyllum commune]
MQLRQARIQHHIFPNLQTLSLVAGYADILPALLAPSITELELIMHHRSMVLGERRTIRILLGETPSGLGNGVTAPSRCGCFLPVVRKLHVVLDYPENQNHLFRELLTHHGRPIHSLVIHSSHLDTATLHAIATLPNLEHFEVYGGYREVDFGVEGGEEGAESEFEFCELEGDWESPLLGEGSSSPLLEQGSESPSVAPQKGWGTSPARLVSASVSSSSPPTSSPPTSSPSPPRATRLKSLAIDILTSGVLVPYISGTVPVPSIGGTILRILNPPALTRLTMERILSAEHARRVCGDIAGSYFPHSSHPSSPSPSCGANAPSSVAHSPSSAAHSPSSAAHSPSSNPLLTTLIHLTLADDWSGTTIAPLRALHACRSL